MTAAALTALAACSDEIYSGGALGSGRRVSVSVNYEAATPTDVVVTRSGATTEENKLQNLQIFIFSAETDSIVGYEWIDTDLNQDGGVGEVKQMSALSGKCYIYGVANVSNEKDNNITADYNVGKDDSGDYPIPLSSTDITENGSLWTDAQVTGGNSKLTLEKFKKIVFNRNTGIEVSTAFLMCGVMNNGNPVNIDDVGNISPLDAYGNADTSGNKVIKLRRVVSKITVNINAGYKTNPDDDATLTNKKTLNDGTEVKLSFKPTSCAIVNIPQTGRLVEGTSGTTESTFTTADTELYDATTTNSEDAVKQYTLTSRYLPENLQTASKPDEIKEWIDREKDNGGDNDASTKTFTNAPENATYLKISGTYTETTTSSVSAKVTTMANTTYYVHLGEFGKEKGYTDFKVERNCHYIYNIYVRGVDEIDTEVEKDTEKQTNGAVEGLRVSLTDDSEIYEVDSHYGQLNMTFPASCVVPDKVEEPTEYFLYFFFKDWRFTSKVLKISKTEKGGELIIKQQDGTDESGIMKWTDPEESLETLKGYLDWIEFTDGIGDDGKGVDYTVAKKKQNDGDKTALKDIFTVIGELIDKKIEDYNYDSTTKDDGADWKKEYTCYINENFYEGKLWNEFTNQPPRYAYICKDLMSSHDMRSISGAVIYGISQKSIQTYYDPTLASTTNAFGCETDCEDNYGNRSSNAGDSIKLKDGREYWSGANESWYGRESFVAGIRAIWINGEQLNWNLLRGVGYDTDKAKDVTCYEAAQFACMSRNRDLNGNGVIDDNEMRWYTPTMAQYTGLFIGQYAIDAEARLFTGNTKNLTEPDGEGGYLKRGAPAYHYWACYPNGVDGKYDNERHIYWSEEGMATASANPGTVNASDSAPWGVRCLRDLPKNTEDINSKPERIYTFNNRKFSIHTLSSDGVRSTKTAHDLAPHEESGVYSYLNKPAMGFVVAENVIGPTNYNSLTGDASTICSSYSEDDESDKGKWRAPNLMELC